jgi:hypothetical protein
MAFNGPQWTALTDYDSPTIRGQKAQWPHDLYKLEVRLRLMFDGQA